MRKRVVIVACLALVAGGELGPPEGVRGGGGLGAPPFLINGPNIRTPGGNQIVGNYDRHGFNYVVPANEEGAGTQIVMVLLNEETVNLMGGSSPPETGRRCRPGSG